MLPEDLAKSALGESEKKPISHDNAALGKGGHLTLSYAVSLASTGVSRDYVARALLARGLSPDVTREMVETAFQAAGQRARGRSRITMTAGGFLAIAGLLMCIAVHRSSNGEYWSPIGVAFLTFGGATIALGWIASARAPRS